MKNIKSTSKHPFWTFRSGFTISINELVTRHLKHKIMKIYPYLLVLLFSVSCNKDQIQPIAHACFDLNPNTNINIGDTLKFTNCSENATTFYWNFGDGFNSIDITPYHVFVNRGEYIIMLTAKNDFSVDSVSKSIQVDDPFYTELNDTLLEVPWANGSRIFNIDIDKDSITDIAVTSFSSYSSSSGSYEYVQIEALNEYEIAFSKCITTTWESWGTDTIFYIDTVLIPKVFIIGDTILNDDNYIQNPLMITYSYTPRGPGTDHMSGLYYGIPKQTGYYYFAFRNMNGNNPKLAWLRVRGVGGRSICLNSCRFIYSESFFIIE
jgi:PKD repeat protein